MEPSAQPWSERSSSGDSGSGYGSFRQGSADDATQGFGPLPGYGPAGTPGPAPEEEPRLRPDGPPRARTGLVALVAFLFELVVIAAWGNQWVSDRVSRHLDEIRSGFLRELVASALTFRWRFSPRGDSDTGHQWLAQLMLQVAFLVVSVALIALAVRGVVTFWRAFFGVWTAAVAAAVVASMVRGAIVDPSSVNLSGKDARAVSALFGPLGPSQSVVVGGLLLGLAVALLASILAVTTRRAPMVPMAAEWVEGAPQERIEVPPPYYGDVPLGGPLPYGEHATGRSGSGSDYSAEGARHAAERGDAASGATQRLPVYDAPAPTNDLESTDDSSGIRNPTDDSDSTMQFARPTLAGTAPVDESDPDLEEAEPSPAAEPAAAAQPAAEPAADARPPAEPAAAPQPSGPETTRFADPRN